MSKHGIRMIIDIASFMESLSVAIDYVEAEILKITPYHGKRVAAIAHLLGKAAGMNEHDLNIFTMTGMFHDCALTEYFKDEFGNGGAVTEKNMTAHCAAGEKILAKLPFYDCVQTAVLYHHERADGGGAFGKTAGETPLFGRLMHFADCIDVHFSQEPVTHERYLRLLSWVKEETGAMIDKESADLFLSAVTEEFFDNLRDENIARYLHENLLHPMVEISPAALKDISAVFGIITDYKSEFTEKHSIGVAEKVSCLARRLGYDTETCDKLYVAGALHDVGKLMISNAILEKAGRLSDDEFKTIKNHAQGTWILLKDIKGLEDIARWASLHHEKLNGTGYPFGLEADDLGIFERMMTVCDIYQALVEKRPYKEGLPHAKAIAILQEAADKGEVDKTLVCEADRAFA
ncbi:MAG TPA: HD domain-containing protein [Methanocorpusculum sp.]|nr:HD domain-containing protein [Methanocorpusculum sp.]